MLKRLVGLIAIVMAAPVVAHAQWKADCTPDRFTDKPHCAMIQRVWLPGPDHSFIMLGYEVPPGRIAIAGDRYGSRARLRIDGNTAMVSDMCARELCIFSPQQTAAALRQLRSGSTALIEFTRSDGTRLGPVEVSLSGFDAAYQQMAAGH